MKVVMTLLVRNAEDLLRENLEFHLQQGVDFFVITDNLSVDGTRDIIEHYVRAGLAEGIREPEDTFNQARWVTRMARRAADKHRADWVINSDDDEFWSGRAGTLRDHLAGIPASVDSIKVKRRNHPPVPAPETTHFLASMVYRERTSLNVLGRPLAPKLCHRAFSDVTIDQGNHTASRAGHELASEPADAIAISHFPIRGFREFERKIANGGAAYARNTVLGDGVGATWRWLYKVLREGRLREWYDLQLLGPDELLRRLSDGALVKDESVLRAVGSLRGELCSREA